MGFRLILQGFDPAKNMAYATVEGYEKTELVPVVQFDKARFEANKNAIVYEKKYGVELSEKIPAEKRKVSLFTIVTSPGALTVPFRLEKIGGLDKDGYLTPKISPSVKNVGITPSTIMVRFQTSRLGLRYKRVGLFSIPTNI